MSPDLALYSDWSCGIVLDDVVFKKVWSTSLIAVSVGIPCNHKTEHHLKVWSLVILTFKLLLISEGNFPKLQQF